MDIGRVLRVYLEMEKRLRRKKTSSGQSLKIVIMGDSSVGKTSLIQRYVGGYYIESLTPTIGVDFKIKAMSVENTKFNLQIWDTAGQERFKTFTRSYFQGCAAVILMFSLSDRQSFLSIQNWIANVQQHTDPKTIKILVGSKLDSPDDRQVMIQQCAQFAFANDLPYFQVSSKTGYNIENVFVGVVRAYMKRDQSEEVETAESERGSVKLDRRGDFLGQLKKCEC